MCLISNTVAFDTWSFLPSWNTFFTWFLRCPSLLVPSVLWVTLFISILFHGSLLFSDLSTLKWSRAQFLEYLTLPTFWTVLYPAYILKSCGELLKDADAFALLHCILGVKTRSSYYKYPGCQGWDPSPRWSHPLNILYSGDSQNVSPPADLSSELQTPLSNYLFHTITWIDNGYFKSNILKFKLLIFLPKPNPVLLAVFQSALMIAPYFQLLRPNKSKSSLTPIFLSH